MAYIGNDLRSNEDYKIIDDISSGFNGSATSFALQVGGATPVPFPKFEQQLLISVNGVIQEPDPTGSAGFKLSGTNIVFSSAPTNGHAFFGVIYAGADYVNAGGAFPDGSINFPSITFGADTNTGFTRIASGTVALISDGTKVAQFPTNQGSNGQALTTDGGGNLSFSTINTDLVSDTSPQLGGDLASNGNDIDFADGDKAVFGTGEDMKIFHSSDINQITTGNKVFKIFGGGSNNKTIFATATTNAAELYFDNSKKLETASGGVAITGALDCTERIDIDANNQPLRIGASQNLQMVYTGSAAEIKNIDASTPIKIKVKDGNEDAVVCNANGSVELYNDNVKRFNTNSSGAKVHGNSGNIFEASCATNSTASILFQNTEANTSGDIRILLKTATNQGSDPYIKFDAGGNDMIVGTLYAGGANNKLVLGHGNSPSGGVIGLHIDGNGNITPDSNNARNLGSSSLRFADIFTNDLNLSNEGSSNDVDGTWGNYTIQEGAEDLFLINHRTGKKFKFNLTEVG